MRWYDRLLRGAEIGLYVFMFIIMLGGSSQILSSLPADAARRFTRPDEFDFVNWTMDAIGIKLGQATLDTPYYFTENSRHQLMVEYLGLIDSILKDEDRLNLFYTDPTVSDPATASASLRDSLDHLYARQRLIGPLAESILQEQISATLADLDLTTGGQPVPPVLFHMTPLPYNLVISPRDKIEQDDSLITYSGSDCRQTSKSRRKGGPQPGCILAGCPDRWHRDLPDHGRADHRLGLAF